MTYAIAVPFFFVALTAGLARGFSGFGAALIFMPLASALVGPQTASAVLVLTDVALVAPLIPGAAARVSLAPIATMLVGAAVTVPIGAWILQAGDPVALRWMIAGLAIGMLALIGSGWRYRGAPKPAISVAVGATSGLFVGIAQLGGPPVVAYWLGGGEPAADARAKIILFLAGGSVISVIAYFLNGFITRETLLWSAVVGPAYGAGLYGGARLFGLVSEQRFRQVCIALIFLSVALSLPVWS